MELKKGMKVKVDCTTCSHSGCGGEYGTHGRETTIKATGCISQWGDTELGPEVSAFCCPSSQLTPVVEEYHGFKVGEECQYLGEYRVRVANWDAVRAAPCPNTKGVMASGGVPSRQLRRSVPFLFLSGRKMGMCSWGSPEHFERIPTRVPLTEVKTKEEMDAWAGTKVCLMGKEYIFGGLPEENEFVLTGNFNKLYFEGKHTDGEIWRLMRKDVRPLTDAPKREEKASDSVLISTGAFHIETGTGDIIIDEVDHIAHCPHCRCTEGEEHAQDCPCRVFEPPPAQPDYNDPAFAYQKVEVECGCEQCEGCKRKSRNAFLDDLCSGPWVPPSELAPPKGKRGKY